MKIQLKFFKIKKIKIFLLKDGAQENPATDIRKIRLKGVRLQKAVV